MVMCIWGCCPDYSFHDADSFIVNHSTGAIITGKIYYNDSYGNHWVTSDPDDEWRKWKDGKRHDAFEKAWLNKSAKDLEDLKK